MLAEPCAACGRTDLDSHLRVAGEPGGDGLIPTNDRFGTALADIVRCRTCGHMQLERFPAEADLSEAYVEAESDAYLEQEDGQRATATAVLERIERARGGERGALLDLGCWVGFLLDQARRRGWEVEGIEPSAFASSHARHHFGLEVATAGIFDSEPAGRFDAVVLADVLEHLPRAGEALERVATMLAPGGVVAIALPDAGSRVARAMGARWWSVIPTHVQYFTRNSIRRLLARQGYTVVSLETQPKTFTVGYYLGRFGGYSPGLGRALVGASAAVGLRDRPWTPDFGDRMLIVARRA